jgi:hypothetical protein
MPYRVSLTECECRSIAQKVFTQKASAPAHSSQPTADAGANNCPAGLNHRIRHSPAEHAVRLYLPCFGSVMSNS